MDWSIKFTDIAIVIATFFGPIMAVRAQRKIDARNDRDRRRRAVFQTLMRTRGAPLSQEHVNAINEVPLEFWEKDAESTAVRTAWKVYLNHLGRDTSAGGWGEKRVELLIELLQKMGHSLGYEHDAVELEKEVYMPIAHGALLSDQEAIRQGLVRLFKGDFAVPITVEKMAADPAMVARWQQVLDKLNAELDVRAKARAPAPHQGLRDMPAYGTPSG